MRRLVMAVLLCCASSMFADAWKRPDANGQCPERHAITGDIGITHLICYGGACTVNERAGTGYMHSFSSEPFIGGVAREGPANGILREGDAIVAVDGALITTAEGGRRLASLIANVPVLLRVRRGDDVREVSVIPVRGCNMPSLTVTSRREAMAIRDATPATPPIEFGMELDCGDCGWRREHGRVVWRTSDFPRVASVTAGGPAARAGIRAGDVLLRVGDAAIIEARAGDVLASTAPGASVALQIVRGSEKLNVTIVPRAAR